MKSINTALASYGMSGAVFHGPLLEVHPDFQITKILERNAQHSKTKHPGAVIVRNYEEILKDAEIELIIVNTPDYLHHQMALMALEAGKHIVIEKPFTLKTEEADEIIDIGLKKSLMVSVFQNRRWDGDFLTVQKIIREGQLGRLVSFESHFDRFRNYIQDSWKEDKSLGAGTLYNLGSHMIDQALQLFGMPEYLFADVRAQRNSATVDDSFDIMMHYPAIKCLVRGSYLVKEAGPRYILHGTEGSFIKSGLDPQEAMLKAGQNLTIKVGGADNPEYFGVLNTGINGVEVRKSVATLNGNYLSYYDNISAHLRQGMALEVTALQARNVIKVIEAAYESAAMAEVVQL